MKFSLGILLCGVLLNLSAQQADVVLFDGNTLVLQTMGVLEDQQYEISEVTKASFRRDSLLYSNAAAYWVKLAIRNPTSEPTEVMINVFPMFSNTLYQWDTNTQDWQPSVSGLSVRDGQRRFGMHTCRLAADTVTIFFVRVDMRPLQKAYPDGRPILLRATIEPKSRYDEQEAFMLLLWLATMCVVVAFLIYNGYIYYFFRDATYRYYLLILLGAIFYITGLNRFFNVLTNWRAHAFRLTDTGLMYWEELNYVLANLGIVLVMMGFVQLTRVYLDMSARLPKLDLVLKFAGWFLILIIAIPELLTITRAYYAIHYFSLYINLTILVIIGLMLWSGVAAYRKGYRPAKYYLLAHSVPLLLMLALTVYFTKYTMYGRGAYLLPNLAVVSQAIAFSIAIVARFQLLKEELHRQSLSLIATQSKNEQLKEKLSFNQRELASSAMHAYQKNEVLNELKKQVDQLAQSDENKKLELVRKIKSEINRNLHLDADWEKFKIHFQDVHPDFFVQLKQEYPNLTQNEIRLSAYLHINLSVKEIATILNIDPASVRKAKTRLTQKMKKNST